MSYWGEPEESWREAIAAFIVFLLLVAALYGAVLLVGASYSR